MSINNRDVHYFLFFDYCLLGILRVYQGVVFIMDKMILWITENHFCDT